MTSCTVLIACLITVIIIIILGYGSMYANDNTSSWNLWGGYATSLWKSKTEEDGNSHKISSKKEVRLSKISMNAETHTSLTQLLMDMKDDYKITLMVHSERCPWCKKMLKTYEQLVADDANKNIIGNSVHTLEVGPELKTAGKLVQTILRNVKGLPTIFTISKVNGDLFANVFSGYSTPEAYAAKLKSASKISL